MEPARPCLGKQKRDDSRCGFVHSEKHNPAMCLHNKWKRTLFLHQRGLEACLVVKHGEGWANRLQVVKPLLDTFFSSAVAVLDNGYNITPVPLACPCNGTTTMSTVFGSLLLLL